MENVYPFQSLGQLLNFYSTKHPTRHKPFTFAERVSHARPEKHRVNIKRAGFFLDHFEDEHGLWVVVSQIIARVFKSLGGRDAPEVQAFIICELGSIADREKQPHPRELARQWHISSDKMYRYLRKTRRYLKEAFIEERLLPPEDYGLVR